MAVILYRKGNVDVVNGVSCESVRIDPKYLDDHLKAGWVVDPAVLKDEAEAQIKKKLGRKPKQTQEAALNESHEG